MTEHGPDIDDPANIPFREPLGPPMTHAQLAHAYQRRERCEDELQDAKQRIAALEAALARAATVVDAWKNYPKDVEMDPLFWSIEDLWTALDAARAGADAGETLLLSYPTGQMTTGRVVASGERPPLVIVDDGADAEED